MSSVLPRAATAGVLAAAGVLALSAPAAAHPHAITKNGQVIANGQNHYAFHADGTSCDTYSPAGSAAVGSAWYGLEVAHHGPDGGAPGKGDGCYRTTVQPGSTGTGWVPTSPDRNPAIG